MSLERQLECDSFHGASPLYPIQTWLTCEAEQTSIIICIACVIGTRPRSLPRVQVRSPRRPEVTGSSFLQLMLFLYGTALIMTRAVQALTERAHGKIPSGEIRETMNKLVCEERGRESKETPEGHLPPQTKVIRFSPTVGQEKPWIFGANSHPFCTKTEWSTEISLPFFFTLLINETCTELERWGHRWRLVFAARKVINRNCDNQKWTFYPYGGCSGFDNLFL